MQVLAIRAEDGVGVNNLLCQTLQLAVAKVSGKIARAVVRSFQRNARILSSKMFPVFALTVERTLALPMVWRIRQ